MHENYFRCWRCGSHPPMQTLALVLNVSLQETYEIVKAYGVLRTNIDFTPKGKVPFALPSNVTKLKKEHKKYLKERNFNPSKLEEIFGLKGTGSFSQLDDGYGKIIDYRFRIIIPFTWNGETVTFDARDITEKQGNKYQACPVTREAVEHKKIVYGNQEAWGDTGICIEGPTDVWRLGENSFALSGIEYKQDQVRVISNTFKKVAIVFDEGKTETKNARRLMKDLRFRNVDAYIHKIKGDPGSMSDNDAKRLVKKLLNKK